MTLIEYIQEHNLSLTKLSKETGISLSTLSKHVNKGRKLIRRNKEILAKLGITNFGEEEKTNRNEFAVYEGEEIVAIGTAEECAKKLNITPATVMYYTTPAYRRKLEKRPNPNEARIAIKIELDE